MQNGWCPLASDRILQPDNTLFTLTTAASPDTNYVMSEAVFTANHLTDTDKQNENKMRKKK